MKSVHDVMGGPVIVDRDMGIHGIVTRQATVTVGSTLHLHGILMGELIVEPEARAFVHGMVNGTIFNNGGLVEVHRP